MGLKLPTPKQLAAMQSDVNNPLHDATEEAKRKLSILLRPGGSQHIQITPEDAKLREELVGLCDYLKSGEMYGPQPKAAEAIEAAIEVFEQHLIQRLTLGDARRELRELRARCTADAGVSQPGPAAGASEALRVPLHIAKEVARLKSALPVKTESWFSVSRELLTILLDAALASPEATKETP